MPRLEQNASKHEVTPTNEPVSEHDVISRRRVGSGRAHPQRVCKRRHSVACGARAFVGPGGAGGGESQPVGGQWGNSHGGAGPAAWLPQRAC